MAKNRAQLKVEVMARLEAVVDEALAEAEASDKQNLSGIEGIAMQARNRVSEVLTQVLVDRGGEQQVPGPVCNTCGQEMRYKGQKPRYVRTRTGEVAVTRAYYYCPRCKRGLFPPG